MMGYALRSGRLGMAGLGLLAALALTACDNAATTVTPLPAAAPAPAPGTAATAPVWSKVSAGGYHGLATKSDGTLWGWGYAWDGQIGNGTQGDPTPSGGSTGYISKPVQVGAATDWASVSAGDFHTLAVKADGSLWSWGYNWYGQLGNGATLSSLIPVRVGAATDWSMVAAGGGYTVALKKNGSVWAWGYNGYGQLGDTTFMNSSTPQPVCAPGSTSTPCAALTGVVYVAAGPYHALAVKADGTVWGWGNNFESELGTGTGPSYITAPVQVCQTYTTICTAYLTNVTAVSAGFYHSLALKGDGTAWAWGYNGFGGTGVGTTVASVQPTAAQVCVAYDPGTATCTGYLTGVVALDAGIGHSLARKGDGTLWSWGDNYNGQLGDGTLSLRAVAAQVGAASDWAGIPSGGNAFSFGLKADGSLWGWGKDDQWDFQLGQPATELCGGNGCITKPARMN